MSVDTDQQHNPARLESEVQEEEAMARHTIHFLDAQGAIEATQSLECLCDDDAIDHVGESEHPRAIDVFDGALVRFLPLCH